ncbi:hypothetical protein AJ78_08677 [Emergomyces pasteurianus Ep9510]|uniref:Uncharacterized protein n=1 Tax=Emergomyces pasteurianus Ep9510 TaxID=1447872 RepID=A0A1J9P222_9EURO|nr:hypothetical protein AJ78_08677 [Emergomyces pasteurianus Ep9510]
MVTIALCQLLLLGLASGKVAQRALLPDAGELYSKLDPVLPPPQKYSLSKWTAQEVNQGLPSEGFWTRTLYDKESENYCKNHFSVYNVTFIDCPEPWLVGHCAEGDTSKEDTFDMLGRLPSSARGAISDLLHVKLRRNHRLRFVTGHTAVFGGSASSIEGLKMMVTSIWTGSEIPLDLFAKAIAADSCVADERAVEDLETGEYKAAFEGGLIVAAYLKLVKSPPLDASCMSTQVNFLRTYLNARWDAPGQCPNKEAPILVRNKPILFPDGMGVLDIEPVPSPVAKVRQWEKSEGYPEFCWDISQIPTPSGPTCPADNLNVYDVTYSDCPDQDPWPICHCRTTQMSVNETVAKFGRIPAGLRSYVRSYLALDDDYNGVGLFTDGFIVSVGFPQDSGYMYAASENVNGDFSQNQTFIDAVSKDTCWPTEMHPDDEPEYETFCKTGVAYLYDSSGTSLLQRGYDISCMANGLRALGAYVGHHYKQNSKCFKRKPVRIVHPGQSFQPAQPFAYSELKRKLSGRPLSWMEVTKLDKS